MNYWVLGGTSEICYILDSGYNVWDFSYSGVRLLSQFIDIIGVNGNKANVSVLELSSWGDVCPYVQTDYLSYNILSSPDQLAEWRDMGCLIDESLQIYSPNLVLIDKVHALVSEFGDLLHLYVESHRIIRISDIARRIVGSISGRDFTIILDESVKLSNSQPFREVYGTVTVLFDYHGNDKKYDMDSIYMTTRDTSPAVILYKRLS